MKKLGYLVGAAVFAYLHGPSNLGSWIIYGGMSLILTWVAYRYKRVEYSILLHLTMNAFAFLITILVSFPSRLKYGRMIGPMGFIQKLW